MMDNGLMSLELGNQSRPHLELKLKTKMQWNKFY